MEKLIEKSAIARDHPAIAESLSNRCLKVFVTTAAAAAAAAVVVVAVVKSRKMIPLISLRSQDQPRVVQTRGLHYGRQSYEALCFPFITHFPTIPGSALLVR